METIEKEANVIAENLTHILPILGKIFTRGLMSKTNFGKQTLQVIGLLAYHGKLTMSGIGTHLSISKPQVTTLIDKLIAEELVERLNDEHDRRIIYIWLTNKGKDKFQKVKALMTESLRTILLQTDQETVHKLKDSSTVLSDVLIDINNTLHTNCHHNCNNNES